MMFQDLFVRQSINLYAGDIVNRGNEYGSWCGLSLDLDNENHIKFDITNKFPLDENTIDAFQSEDVFEHIKYEKLVDVIDEVYRILKPGSLFRLSLPDYNCDILYKRTLYNYKGELVFDPGGGGSLDNPGHLWFPTYDKVKILLKKTRFFQSGRIDFLHYYLGKTEFVVNEVNYTKGFIQRTPDHDKRVQNPYRPMSIVIDLYKGV